MAYWFTVLYQKLPSKEAITAKELPWNDTTAWKNCSILHIRVCITMLNTGIDVGMTN